MDHTPLARSMRARTQAPVLRFVFLNARERVVLLSDEIKKKSELNTGGVSFWLIDDGCL